jgi:hypothetical protein
MRQQPQIALRRRPSLPLLLLLVLSTVASGFLRAPTPPPRRLVAPPPSLARAGVLVAAPASASATTTAAGAAAAAAGEAPAEGEASSGTKAKLVFKGLQSERFRHPLDQQATEQLRRLPGLEWVVRRLMRVAEEAVYLVRGGREEEGAKERAVD